MSMSRKKEIIKKGLSLMLLLSLALALGQQFFATVSYAAPPPAKLKALQLAVKENQGGGSVDKSLAGRKFWFWQITGAESQLELEEMLSALAPLSKENLDQRYGAAVELPPAAPDGRIHLSALSAGRYYLREILKGQEKWHVIPSAFSLTAELIAQLNSEPAPVIYLKEELVPEAGKGGLLLYKYDKQSKKPLPGVSFKLYRILPDMAQVAVFVKNGQYTADKSGSDVLVTDSNGYISVSGLPAGEYFWKEVKTLAGYELRSFEFRVSVVVGQVSPTNVDNQRIPTPTTTGPAPTPATTPAPTPPGKPSQPQPHPTPPGGPTKPGRPPSTGEHGLPPLVLLVVVSAAVVVLLLRLSSLRRKVQED